jgi:hypothetical protein
MLKRHAKVILMAVLFMPALSGCAMFGVRTGKICPSAAVLAETSSLTTFQPSMKNDPAGEVYTIGMADVKTACDFDADNGTTNSSLELALKAKRPAPGDQVSYRVPYFVVTSLGGTVVDKRVAWLNITFASGATTAETSENVDAMMITLENGKKPYDYQLLVGFQLTQDQLDYNRKMNRFAS